MAQTTIACGNCKAENPKGAGHCWACHAPKCEKAPAPTAAAAKIQKKRDAAAKKARAASKKKRAVVR